MYLHKNGPCNIDSESLCHFNGFQIISKQVIFKNMENNKITQEHAFPIGTHSLCFWFTMLAGVPSIVYVFYKTKHVKTHSTR